MKCIAGRACQQAAQLLVLYCLLAHAATRALYGDPTVRARTAVAHVHAEANVLTQACVQWLSSRGAGRRGFHRVQIVSHTSVGSYCAHDSTLQAAAHARAWEFWQPDRHALCAVGLGGEGM